jgi:hypothetical protein
MYENTIALVKSITVGRCTCYEMGGSCSFSVDPETGKPIYNSTSGTKIQCMRCKARTALEADGVEYEKADYVPYTTLKSIGY